MTDSIYEVKVIMKSSHIDYVRQFVDETLANKNNGIDILAVVQTKQSDVEK